MLSRPVTSDDLARLRAERDEADRRYNEALTALDVVIPLAVSAAITALCIVYGLPWQHEVQRAVRQQLDD